MILKQIPRKKFIRLGGRSLPAKAVQPKTELLKFEGRTPWPVPAHRDGVDAAADVMTAEQLISRAKHRIGTGETSRNTSFRAAAEDIARACDQGATQREVATGVGKSVAWVNRLLKWRQEGYVGAPFADKIVQGVNKDAPFEPSSTKSLSAAINPTSPNREAAATGDGERPAAPLRPATNTLSDAATGDYRLPHALNRQDPERAFQRLTEQWSLIPFRDLFLNSPKAAQFRFLRDVVLHEVGEPDALKLLAAGEGRAR